MDPNPLDWEGWVSHMHEKMEKEAERSVKIGDFEKMLRTLADELVNRIESGRW